MGTSTCTVKEAFWSLPALIPFPLGRYWLNEATMVLFVEDGRQAARQIPAKSIVVIGRDALKNCTSSFEDEKLMRATWCQKEILMFTQDFKSKAEHLGQQAQ